MINLIREIMKSFDYVKLAEQINSLSMIIERNTAIMNRMVSRIAQPLKEGRLALDRLSLIINANR